MPRISHQCFFSSSGGTLLCVLLPFHCLCAQRYASSRLYLAPPLMNLIHRSQSMQYSSVVSNPPVRSRSSHRKKELGPYTCGTAWRYIQSCHPGPTEHFRTFPFPSINSWFPVIHSTRPSASVRHLTFFNAPGRRRSSAFSQKNHCPFAFAKPLFKASDCPASGSMSPSWTITSRLSPIPCIDKLARASSKYGRGPFTGTTQLNNGVFIYGFIPAESHQLPDTLTDKRIASSRSIFMFTPNSDFALSTTGTYTDGR